MSAPPASCASSSSAGPITTWLTLPPFPREGQRTASAGRVTGRPELPRTSPRRRRPPSAPGLRPLLQAAPSGGEDAATATRRAGRQGAGPGADARAARATDSCGSRGRRTALSGRAPRELGGAAGARPCGQTRRQKESRASGGRRPHSLRPVPASPSGPRPLPTRALQPTPRQPVPRRVVDETWLTPVFGSLVRLRRRSPSCDCCLRAASSPSAILYRFKINSPLTSNAAAALSTSREPAERRRVLAPPSTAPPCPPHALLRPAPRRPRSASALLALQPAARFSQASTLGRNWAVPPPQSSHTPTALSPGPHPLSAVRV